MRFTWLWLLGIGLALSQARAADTTYPTLPLGSAAPDFRLPGVNGRDYSLQDFASARILVVVFTCNHCPTAQYYEERLKQLVADYRDRGVAVVAISPNDPRAVRLDELGYADSSDSLAEMKVRSQYKQYNFPYLYDGETQAASRAYGPVVTPHVFVFDSARKLRYVGRIDDAEREQFVKTRDTRDALEALLAGREIAVKQTKTVGCSIKWAAKADSVQKYMDQLAAEPVNVELADAAALKALRKNKSGKLRLINFWATWCAPCTREFPELVTIHRMYRNRDFELVTVAANYPDEKAQVLSFLKKQQASSRNLLFGDTDKYKLMEAFDPQWNNALPFTVLVDPEGQVLYRRQGELEVIELRRAIVKTLNQRKPW